MNQQLKELLKKAIKDLATKEYIEELILILEKKLESIKAEKIEHNSLE